MIWVNLKRKHREKQLRRRGCFVDLYSMKIKEQTRKLAVGCSKHCFEVVDRTDEVSSKHSFEVVDRTDEVSNHIYGKAKLTWFEEYYSSSGVRIIGMMIGSRSVFS
ncbi:N-ethylammeline chlorohydrolase [Streptococcus pneumoniae]|nr:N-ethylammeline chlorohydrolase [Streptococcus pneumoniae]